MDRTSKIEDFSQVLKQYEQVMDANELKEHEELLGINKVGKRCECGSMLESESLFCGECGKK